MRKKAQAPTMNQRAMAAAQQAAMAQRQMAPAGAAPQGPMDADGDGAGMKKGGAMKKMKKGGMAAYERSEADKKKDREGAKKRGMTVKQYEKTAEDEREDKKEAKRLGYMKKGGNVKKYARGGGIEIRGKTRGRII
ncbi:MAG TPA: hypothetical protein PLQ34_09515 [Ferrovaceae bacterium]|nr:hypothetical protein [Ferrovaceae bacterium]